ncbi:conjugal transfer protein TraI [Mucilaginibacter limnophilus]|uniref:Conjugal transfer protein TraI n=1 Tax=Mucilaginibacter limnophilus TaxID=1932778 RepID=A0A3S2UJL2_9SPHI|nr:conjugal transfer protein TraI [Mucilaginibacter limnophilus]RVT98453.1 conjugal transfer protein TraI [Mucilaginibacter limnophilus]
MKKLKILLLVASLCWVQQSHAQIAIAEAVKLVVKKVIKAIDLKVQRLQNQTIWLQNAQKTLENELSKFRLTEISDWSEKQKMIYDNYYQELLKVKSVIAYYQRIKTLSLKQVAMVSEYQRAWRLFQSDKHFKPGELAEMQRVYLGILEASARNLDQIMLVIHPGKTQMTDQQRLEMINKTGDLLDENYSDLKQYNHQNMILSLQRSKDLIELRTIRQYYGIHE